MKKRLAKILEDTLELCFKGGHLRQMPLPEFVIEVPNNPHHGHFATNLAMTLAGGQKSSPLIIAEVITNNLVDHDRLIRKTEIGGAGFINFFISTEQWYHLLARVIRLGDDYGRSSLGKGRGLW